MITGIILNDGGGSQCSIISEGEYIEITIINDGLPGGNQGIARYQLLKENVGEFYDALKKVSDA